ncbi:MAG: hypothetical protein LBB15_02000 [Puniceicoccales bacterium]|nr:hypothetical protein [Puniceicoccales bacterium]
MTEKTLNDVERTMNPTNQQPNFNAALPRNIETQQCLQDGANHNRTAASRDIQLVSREQIVDERHLVDRLLQGVELADLANIIAGILGLYVANKCRTSKWAGVLMAGSGQYLACMVPLLAKSNVLMGMAVSFLAGIIGSKNIYEFIMGYFSSKAICIGISCIYKLYSNCVSLVRV